LKIIKESIMAANPMATLPIAIWVMSEENRLPLLLLRRWAINQSTLFTFMS